MTSSRLFENGITDFLETGRRGPTLATQAMLCTPAAAAVAVVAGKVEEMAKKKVDDGATDEAVEAPTRTVVARPRLLVAMVTTPKPPAEVLQWASAIGVARRAIGGASVRRSYAVDARDAGTLPMPVPCPRIDAVDATGWGTLLMSARHRKKKLSWR